MLWTYRAFFRELSDTEVEVFYAESRILGSLFGVAEEVLPGSVSEFHTYFDEMLSGPILEIKSTAHSIAENILHPPLRGMPRSLGLITSIPALALLPNELRERYGFRWDHKHERAWKYLRRVLRRAVPYTPSLIRINAGARRAEKRH